jgi:hypothetical protein
VQGLWCELFLIFKSRSIQSVAQAWHANPRELHDFVSGTQILEVKSTLDPLRPHQFSLEQLERVGESRILIASFVLEERDDASGWSLRDLWEQVANRSELSLELRNGLYERLMRALGRDWGDANRYRFDPNTAHEHMKLYDADNIPRVSPELPPEVSRVRFQSELSGVPTVSKQDPDLRIGLFGEMFG